MTHFKRTRRTCAILAVLSLIASPILFMVESEIETQLEALISHSGATYTSLEAQPDEKQATPAEVEQPSPLISSQRRSVQIAAAPTLSAGAPDALRSDSETPLAETPNETAASTETSSAPAAALNPVGLNDKALTAAEKEGFSVASHIISLAVSLISMLGFASTTYMGWRRDQRTARSEELDLELKALKIEQLKIQITASTSADNKPSLVE